MSDKQEIRALIANWSQALEEKNPDAIVGDYAPNAVLFDAMPPARTVGAKAIRDGWARSLACFPEEFRSEHRDLNIVVGENVAFAFGFHHVAPKAAELTSDSPWMRVTVGFEKTNGRWRVAHEHVSVPFDPRSGKAEMIANP